VSAAVEEYRAAREGGGVFPLPDRAVLEAAGPQRIKFLQGMLSNDVARPTGEGCLAALMDVKGHVQALLRVLVEKDVVRLELPAATLDLVARTLDRYKVAAPVRFAPRPAALFGLVGPRAEDVLRGAGAEPPPPGLEAHRPTALGERPALLARASDLPGDGFVVHADPADADAALAAVRAAGASLLGGETLDVLRVEALRPWHGPDVTAENLIHETGLVAQFCSFSKGCYLGQEVVARLDARGGHVNKALRGLRLSAPAAPGTPLLAEGREVGRITTAGVSPRLGPVALGYVHRSHFAPGTGLRAGEAGATVVDSFAEDA